MSCENCNGLTQHGAPYCNKCYANLFCSMCDRHKNLVGPLSPNKCCDDCLKGSTPDNRKEEEAEMETEIHVEENPHYLTDLVNGWWSDGHKYYFAIQNQIYSAWDIPMDIDEFKRAIVFDTIDAEMCGVIRGTTVIWS